jgi:hypothetical protein
MEETRSSDLHYAACGTCTDTVKKLITSGTHDIDAPAWNGSTALHIAVENRNKEIAAALVEAKANVNARDHFGNTPLLYAAEKADVTLIEYLIGVGADVTAADWRGRTPLHAAVERGKLKSVIAILLTEWKTKRKPGSTYLDSLAPMPDPYTILDEKNYKQIIQDMSHVHLSSVVARDEAGKSPLDYALERFGTSENEAIIRIMTLAQFPLVIQDHNAVNGEADEKEWNLRDGECDGWVAFLERLALPEMPERRKPLLDYFNYICSQFKPYLHELANVADASGRRAGSVLTKDMLTNLGALEKQCSTSWTVDGTEMAETEVSSAMAANRDSDSMKQRRKSPVLEAMQHAAVGAAKAPQAVTEQCCVSCVIM